MKFFVTLFHLFINFESSCRALDRNSICRKKNDEFSFSDKLIHKLVCLANVIILDSVFSFKCSNTVITNCEFEFDSIVAILDSGI